LTYPLLKFDWNPESGMAITVHPSLHCSNRLLNEQVRVNAWSIAQHVWSKHMLMLPHSI